MDEEGTGTLEYYFDDDERGETIDSSTYRPWSSDDEQWVRNECLKTTIIKAFKREPVENNTDTAASFPSFNQTNSADIEYTGEIDDDADDTDLYKIDSRTYSYKKVQNY